MEDVDVLAEGQVGAWPTAGRASAGKPKYAQVRDELAARYFGARPGIALPSEHEICAEFSVSRITARRALDDLARAGLVVRERGRGTYVADSSEDAAPESSRYEVVDLVGFHAYMTGQGRRVSTEVLLQSVVAASNSVATQLRTAMGSPVVRLDRLRRVDGTLHHLTRAWLSDDRFHELVHADLEDCSLFTVLREEYGLKLVEDNVTLFQRRPSGDEATLLEIPNDEYRLASASVLSEADSVPQMYSETLYAAPDARVQLAVHAIRSGK